MPNVSEALRVLSNRTIDSKLVLLAQHRRRDEIVII